MRKIRIDWLDFEGACGSSDESAGFLDLETGQVFSLHRATRDQLRALMNAAGEDASIETLIAKAPGTDWEKQALREALLVENYYGRRVVSIDADALRESHRDLVDFTATVEDVSLRVELERAIRGPGSFRRFRAVIDGTFRERKQWSAFRDERKRERATTWLAPLGVDVEWVLPPPRADLPEPRRHLLEGVLKFVHTVSQLAGVKRIALLGSLTKTEPDPKDADVLVMVTDAMDLTPLAKAGRKLAGHAQQLNRGADVFLANERGDYIGRTCHWRECGPGIRARCDAEHCGRRHFLHDDFDDVRLDASVVSEPPLELWPNVSRRVSVPPDVEIHLIAQLRGQP